MRALVIVDVQPSFPSARDKVLVEKICSLIKEAQQRDRPIFVVEFAGRGATDYRIIKTIGEYSLYRSVTKLDVDGSVEVKRAAVYFSDVDGFDVCGVQTACCVKETAEGLSHYGETRIILEACRDTVEPDAIDQLRQSPHNLVLV